MSSHPHTSEPECENARFDLILAVMLWIGAVCLICAVNYAATRDENIPFQFLFVILHRFYAHWCIAGLAALVGVGMFQSANRRIKSSQNKPEFLQGVVLLESAQWFQQAKARSPAKSSRVPH